RLTAIAAAMMGVFSVACAQEYSPYFDFEPLHYVCFKAPQKVVLDGDIDGAEWAKVPWTEPFRDIQGSRRAVEPAYPTRAKMMWDNEYLYFAAEMVEPHIWATMTRRDDVIYYDNDIEIFIDPDADGHHYYEFEFNAFGTEWDLLLTQPYTRSGTFFTGWDLKGMRTAVKHYGTINDPSDTDQRWTIEVALPIHSLLETIYFKRKIEDGEQWRINFSRVEWMAVEVIDGKYVKKKGKEGFGSEDNWVWSPTGVIDMHYPEFWGFLQFSNVIAGQGCDNFVVHPYDKTKRQLRHLAARAEEFRRQKGSMPTSIDELRPQEIAVSGAIYYPCGNGYKLSLAGEDGVWYSLTSDGRIFPGK
ncbi:MAG: carbohydrate-binding family 9-like protein, partial [Mucinivorans sp.]